MALDRSELIHQLAESMGLEKKENENETTSKYNTSTGTIYCNSNSFSHNTTVKNRLYII